MTGPGGSNTTTAPKAAGSSFLDEWLSKRQQLNANGGASKTPPLRAATPVGVQPQSVASPPATPALSPPPVLPVSAPTAPVVTVPQTFDIRAQDAAQQDIAADPAEFSVRIR
jgi:hypothetical protein